MEPVIAVLQRILRRAHVPLRLPRPSERLDPPVVDILVENGRKHGDINPAEIEAIVDEIAASSPIRNGAPLEIGVISLIGGRQAALIEDRLLHEIGAEAWRGTGSSPAAIRRPSRARSATSSSCRWSPAR